MKCSPACGNCRESDCINSDWLTYEEGVDVDDHNDDDEEEDNNND